MMSEHDEKQKAKKGGPPPIFDAKDRDRMTELQLQNAAQVAGMSVNAPNDALVEQHAKTAIALARAAVHSYAPDGLVSAVFKKSLDAAFIKFQAMIERLEAGKPLRRDAEVVFGMMRDTFSSDGWKEPSSKTDADKLIKDAEKGGATELDQKERIELGELHMQHARDYLVAGRQSFADGQMGGMLHATRALQEASTVLHKIAGFDPTLGKTIVGKECEAIEVELTKLLASVAKKDTKHLNEFARSLDQIAAMAGRPVVWMSNVAHGGK
jgi:hypothetical protein